MAYEDGGHEQRLEASENLDASRCWAVFPSDVIPLVKLLGLRLVGVDSSYLHLLRRIYITRIRSDTLWQLYAWSEIRRIIVLMGQSIQQSHHPPPDGSIII